MVFKRVVKKGLSVLLTAALVMSAGTPVSVLADEASDGITEVSVAEVLLQEEAETEDIMQTEAEKEERDTALPADLNEIVTVENGVINLNGASVVVAAAEGQSNRYQIFPDYDGDKLPDNQIPLKIGEQTYYKLNNYELRGYSDPSKPFDGDISITVSAGIMKGVYGVYGTKEAPVCVNGDVKLYMEGGNVSGYKAIAVYNGKAANVTFSFTDTQNDNVEMYAACQSQVTGDVNYLLGGQAEIKGTTDATHAMIGVAKDSTIGGSVNARIGFESDLYGFLSHSEKYNYIPKYWTKFVGVSDSKVTGNIDYELKGIWTPGTSVFVQGSTVGKDVNIHAVSTKFTAMAGDNSTVMVTDSTIAGNLKFTSDAQTGLTSGGGISLLSGTDTEKKSIVKGDLFVNIPQVNIKNGWTDVGNHANIEGAIYSNVAGSITIDTVESAVYTISENVTGKNLVILEDANVVIGEGVSVELDQDLDVQTGAKLVNKGTLSLSLINRGSTTGTVAGILENKGSLSTQYKSDQIRGKLIIDATGWIVNDKDATWNVGCYVDNQGKIVNYGTFVQTYSYESGVDYYYARLGEFFTTMPLTLSHQINTGMYTHIYDSVNQKYNSKMYYAINVDYPAHCASEPILTGTEIVSSGISGDANKYIRMARVGEGVTSDFTLTPGAVKGEDCALESVTYGTKHTQIEATETSGGKVYTASVLNEFSPITITLDYGEAGKITPITLDKTSDSVTGLIVDQTYTQKAPLYDLTDLTIIGDIVSEEGNVVYTHTSGQLPKGIMFKDAKLYGTFQEACDKEISLTFTVTGLNLTTAEFTLTLDGVAKAVPSWSIPTGFVGKVGQMLDDVLLPTDSRGTYFWETETQSLDWVGTAVANIIFIPNDRYSVDNYDWAAAAGDAWDAENGRIYWPVQIMVKAGKPQVTSPTGLTATYGQTFAEISLPSDEDGTFSWDTAHHALTDTVGNAGENTCYVTYTPANENYEEMSGIAVTLIVSPAVPVYEETLSEIEVFCDQELGEVHFPKKNDGTYLWISDTTVKPKDGEQRSVIYLPNDTANYDWTMMNGWDSERQGVTFSVRIKVVHAWDGGVVKTQPTKESEGEKVFTCGLCGETRTEVLEKLPDASGDVGDNAGNTTGGNAAGDDSGIGQSSVQPQVGYTLSDKKSKAVYKVSVVEKEVTYVKPLKKTYTKVKIPNTVKYDGVTYKVTAIANNAFKNNKKLKSVTIPKNIKTIGNSAFYKCTALKSVTIPKNVSKIGSKAFYGCKKLTKMTIKTSKLTEKKVGKKAFTKMGSSNYKKVKVKVPKKKLKAYKKVLQKRGLSKKAKVKK